MVRMFLIRAKSDDSTPTARSLISVRGRWPAQYEKTQYKRLDKRKPAGFGIVSTRRPLSDRRDPPLRGTFCKTNCPDERKPAGFGIVSNHRPPSDRRGPPLRGTFCKTKRPMKRAARRRGSVRPPRTGNRQTMSNQQRVLYRP